MDDLLNIEDIVPEKNIFVLSPHYDDVPLTFGGFLDSLVKSGMVADKKIRIIQIFSLSNYLNGDDEGNRDLSRERVQRATGIRLTEDLGCMDDLLGHGSYSYELKGELECLLREKELLNENGFEYLPGDRAHFEEGDWEIYRNIRNYARDWLRREDTAVLLPMGMKEHVDHVILREGVMDAWKELGKDVRATVCLGEDLPYTGLASEEEWQKIREFLQEFDVEPRSCVYDAERKTELLRTHYVTQVEESYFEGIANRVAQLQREHGVSSGVERMYRIVPAE